MPISKIHPARNLRNLEFERFRTDLELFLQAFPPALLAKWMKKDAGNISKKLNGIDAITQKDLFDFYGALSSVITKLEMGMPAYEIERQMDAYNQVLIVTPKENMWEAIRKMKETQQIHDAVLKRLKSRVRGSRKRKNGHRRSRVL